LVIIWILHLKELMKIKYSGTPAYGVIAGVTTGTFAIASGATKLTLDLNDNKELSKI